ncbi:hypothetical protein [Streptomyces prasinosporus]|uniref:hypothetical protein n=1 Tax=Streptomyces prasinosporus TaxID=68256 RepID=UPI003CD0619F
MPPRLPPGARATALTRSPQAAAATARPGRTSTRMAKGAAPAITAPASTSSSARSLSAAPAASPAAEIPNSLTAPLVTSPSRSAPGRARNPRRGSPGPGDVVVRPARPGDEDGRSGGGPRPAGRG